MELLQLEYFIKTAELEHISKAAEALHITQPTLSTTIQRLETELGCRLFERQGRGIKLNSCGELFLKHARRILDDVSEARRDISEHLRQMNSTITIYGPSMYLFPGLMDSILAKYPNVIITYLQQDPHIAHLLLSQKLDFCISALSFSEPDIVSDHLSDKKIVLLVPSASEMASRGSVEITELENLSLASLRKDLTIWTYFEGLCRKAGFSPKVTYEARSFQDMLMAVKGGKHAAVSLAHSSLDEPGIAVLEINGVPPHPIYISYNRAYQGNKPVYDIIGIIKDYFRKRA